MDRTRFDDRLDTPIPYALTPRPEVLMHFGVRGRRPRRRVVLERFGVRHSQRFSWDGWSDLLDNDRTVDLSGVLRGGAR